MAAHRKHPPKDALETIERLAAKGYSTVGLAKHFNVSRSVVARWFEENETFEEAYEQGRDSYRQSLEEQIVAMGLAGKNCGGLIYLLKAKFKMFDMPQQETKVDVALNQPVSVMVVKDHGTDAEWEAKVAAQQRALAAPEPLTIQGALPAPQNASTTHEGPVGDLQPVPALLVAPQPSPLPWQR